MQASDRSQHLGQGIIIGEESNGPLSSAPIITLETASGDWVVATTHHGLGYKNTNEDRVVIVEAEHGELIRTCVLVVDGMGGHRGGNLSAQILSEEMVQALKASPGELAGQVHHLLVRRINEIIDRLPSSVLIRETRAALEPRLGAGPTGQSVEEMVQMAMEAVQSASIKTPVTRADHLRRMAEVLRGLATLKPPDPVGIAIHRTRERIASFGFETDPPDACFVGAIMSTSRDGQKLLDVRQIGDCKLFVCTKEGEIRFQTIGESMIPEPDFRNPRVTLAELMTYSLHRNVVTNSVNSKPSAIKRYRQEQLPVTLESGDFVFVYSDGVDDLFSPGELMRLARNQELTGFVRQLLRISELRMAHVSRLLRTERARLPKVKRRKAYPLVHQQINKSRLKEGYYVERYPDGSVGRWTKPPKCDNTSFCMMVIGGADHQARDPSAQPSGSAKGAGAGP